MDKVLTRELVAAQLKNMSEYTKSTNPIHCLDWMKKLVAELEAQKAAGCFVGAWEGKW
jgi:hypothetical protein